MGVRVYPLVDGDELRKLAPTIASTLFRLPASVVGGDVFSIAPGSGFLSYADTAKLWSDLPKPALPKNAQEANNAAMAFVARATRDLERANVTAVLPPASALLQLQTTRVRHPSEAHVDHWLCRFAVTLRPSDSFDEPLAPVAGAGVDVRIGDRGEVIGLTSRWTALRGHRTRTRLHLPAAARDAATPARLVYRLNDEAARQAFLAPYWLVADGHHSAFFPASDHSLTCDILQSTGSDGITLTAVTAGGSGTYEYTWGRAMVLQFPPRIEPLGGTTQRLQIGARETTVSSVSIDATVCDVLLDVVDAVTGARVQLRRSIYPLMALTPALAPPASSPHDHLS